MREEIILLLQYKYHIYRSLAEEIFNKYQDNIDTLLTKMGVM